MMQEASVIIMLYYYISYVYIIYLCISTVVFNKTHMITLILYLNQMLLLVVIYLYFKSF